METAPTINSISCPVCQNLCSSLASSCPKCGHPFTVSKESISEKSKPKDLTPKPKTILEKIFNILAILALFWAGSHVVFIIGSLYFYARANESKYWLDEKGFLIHHVIGGLICYAFFLFLVTMEKNKNK